VQTLLAEPELTVELSGIQGAFQDIIGSYYSERTCQTKVGSLAVGQNQYSLIIEVQSHCNGQSSNTFSNNCWNSPQTVPRILRFFNRLYKLAAKTPLAFG